MPLIWVIVALVALGIEALGRQFILLFVGAAALLTATLAALAVPLQVQILVFALASVCLPFFLRHRLLRHFAGHGVPSRAERLLGISAVVTETIDPVLATGRVTANGQDWQAKSQTRLDIGSLSHVVGCDGIVLVVEPMPPAAPRSH